MGLDIDKIKSYLSTQPVEKAWLFGSFARGEEGPESDVDLLINFTKNKKIGMTYIRMIRELENTLNRHVDLVEENSLLSWIKPFVDKDKILIYERKD